MAFIFYNPNPEGKMVDDCQIRALARILYTTWNAAYSILVMQGFYDKDMPHGNSVMQSVITKYGYEKGIAPNNCPDCYTLRDFCHDNPEGRFLVVSDGHITAVVDGDYYDAWDSGDVVPLFYWKKA